ncbi:terminase gpP N-terminus-related DNA-binding protein [Devosia sp. A449]
MNKYSEKQIIEACELRERGWTYPRIAKKIGMHQASVLEYCQKNGAVSPNCTAVHPAKTFTLEQDAQIIALRQAGHGTSSIARQLGRPVPSVQHRLHAVPSNQAKLEVAMGP